MRVRWRWYLSVALACVAGGSLGIRTQAVTAPILVVVNSGSSNPYGPYLAEILKAEGLNSFSVAQLSTVSASTLTNVKVVVLAETALSGAQAVIMSNFVAGGGGLVAMRPDSGLSSTMGITTLGSSTSNGYLGINTANSTGQGFTGTTLPFYGQSQNNVPNSGLQTLATLYSNVNTATAYPAVVRNGNAVTWSYDLARSVAYARQGNPANSGVDRDGLAPLRTNDVFWHAIDLDRINIPTADVQMRLFSRVISDLLATSMPAPRLWYFAGGKKTVMVVTGDAHANPQSYYDALISSVEARTARATIYVYGGSTPSPSVVQTWRANGHEVGMHPAAFQYGVSVDQAFQNAMAFFTGGGRGAPSATERMHQVQWLGWVDAATVASNYGIGLDTSFYTWGPAVTRNDGTQVHGFINGSGLPMRFVTTTGSIVPVYQLVTSLVDEQLVTGDYSEHLTTSQALAVTRQIVDDSQAGGYSAVMAQFHIDYYSFGEVKPWVDGTMDYAKSLNVPMWTAEHLLNYTTARAATTMTSLGWNAATKQLSFNVTVPGTEAQSMMLPAAYGTDQLAGVSVNSITVPFTNQTINGRVYSFFSINPTAGGAVLATYGPGAPPNAPSLSISDVTVNEGTGSSTTATFTVSMSAPSGQTVTVNYSTADGTATAPGDFTPKSGVLNIASGSTSTTIAVTVAGDATYEPNETFSITLSIPTNATIADPTGVGTIVDDDPLPPPSAATASLEFSGAGSRARFTTLPTLTAFTAEAWVKRTFDAGRYETVFSNASSDYTQVSVGVYVDGANQDCGSSPSDQFAWAYTKPGGGWFFQCSGVSANTNAWHHIAVVRDGSSTARIFIDGVLRGTAANAPAPTASTGSLNIGAAGDAAVESFPGRIDEVRISSIARYSANFTLQTQDFGSDTDTIAVYHFGEGTGQVLADSSPNSRNGFLGTSSAVEAADPIWSADVPYVGGPLRAISIGDVSLTEGNSGTTNATFTLSLSAASGQAVTVAYVAMNATAVAGADFTATSGTATFAIGTTTQTITVPVIGDTLDEATETFSVDLSSPGNATIADAQGIGTILDNDAAPALSVADVSVTEGNSGTASASLTVSLSAASGQTVTVNYATANGTAAAGTDYTAFSGPITISAGSTTQTFTVPILGDTSIEPNETFVVNLSSAVNATIADAQGTITIVNDDGVPLVSINDVSATEGNAGTTNATFTISLSTAGAQAISVAWATANGSASAGADYATASGTANFPIGNTTQNITVPVLGDTLDEVNETFVVNLSNAVSAAISDGQGVGTVLDDDAAPTLAINDISQAEGSAPSTATFTVSLSAPSGQTVTVNYATVNGTAVAPGDFTATTSLLSIPAGNTTGTIPVTVAGDAVNEPTETFSVTLSTPTNATLADATGIGTILDDDPVGPPVVASSLEFNGTSARARFTTLPDMSGVFTVEAWAKRTSDSGRYETIVGDASASFSQVVIGVYVDGGNSDCGSSPSDQFAWAYTKVGGGWFFQCSGVSANLNAWHHIAVGRDASGTARLFIDGVLRVTTTNAAGPTTTTGAFNFGDAGDANTEFFPGRIDEVRVSNVARYTAGFTPQTGDFATDANTVALYHLADGTGQTLADSSGNNRNGFLGTSSAVEASDPSWSTDAPYAGGPQATLSIGDISITEGNSGTSTATFTVTLSIASSQTVTVNYATADLTAAAGSDYTGGSGSLSFTPGATSRSVTVTILGDATLEANETFAVNLSGAANATIADAQGVGTIVNDDVPSISIGDVSVTEGNSGTTNASFTVTLSAASTQVVSVNWATANGTATAGSDYTAGSGTANFAIGTTTQSFNVSVSGDAAVEATETFVVNLSGPVNGTIADAQGTGTIVNDDGVPSISMNDVTVTEGNTGTTNATFTISLSTAGAQAISVAWSTANGTAAAGADYSTASGTANFPIGNTTQTIDVSVLGDTLDEVNETFVVNLSGPVNAAIGDAQGVGTILDDDATPTLAINDVTVTETNAPSTATFTVSLSAPSGQTVTVNYATVNGTAVAPGDFTAVSSVLTIPAGSTSGTIPVTIAGDTTNEPTETFSVTLSTPTNATLADATGIATILNDDPVGPPVVLSSLQFNGSNAQARFTTLPSMSVFTVETWVKRTADTGRYETFLADASASYSQESIGVYVDGGNQDCGSSPADQFAWAYTKVGGGWFFQCSGISANLNAWHHIAVGRDASGAARLFIDGVLRATATGTAAPTTTTGAFNIGDAGDANAEFFPGRIDEVRISNVARYTATFAPQTQDFATDANTIALYHLAEGTGQTLADSSGNGRNGFLGNSSAVEAGDPGWSTDAPYGGP